MWRGRKKVCSMLPLEAGGHVWETVGVGGEGNEGERGGRKVIVQGVREVKERCSTGE